MRISDITSTDKLEYFANVIFNGKIEENDDEYIIEIELDKHMTKVFKYNKKTSEYITYERFGSYNLNFEIEIKNVENFVVCVETEINKIINNRKKFNKKWGIE